MGRSGHTARQRADIAVFEGSLWSQRDIDGLFAVGGHAGAVGSNHSRVDDAEPNFGLRPTRAAASRTVTRGEPYVTVFTPAAFPRASGDFWQQLGDLLGYLRFVILLGRAEALLREMGTDPGVVRMLPQGGRDGLR